MYIHIDTDEPAVKQLLISPVSSHYGFYLTKVSGIDARHNSMWAIHIRGRKQCNTTITVRL